MERVTFFESIIKILKTISSIPHFLEILILTLFLLIIMIFFYFRESKTGRTTAFVIYCVTLLLLPITHFSFFINTVDKIIENYIKVLYFPSCYVYIATLIITDVSLLNSMIKNIKQDNRRWYIIIDLIYFCVFQLLFFLIIRLVIINNINIFERTALYSDVNLTSCIQVSSYLFWIRVGIILINKIVNKLYNLELKSENKIINSQVKDIVEVSEKDIKLNNKIKNTNPSDTYNDQSNELLKKLMGQEYLNISDNNIKSKTNLNKKKQDLANVKNITANPKKDFVEDENKEDYFYDDFFE